MTQTEITNYLKHGALYRKPNGHTVIYLGPFEENSFENSSTSITTQDFFAGPLKFYSAKCHRALGEKEQLLKALESNAQNKGISREDFFPPDKELFAKAFSEVKEQISEGNIQKAVPIVLFQTTEKPKASDLAHWLIHLLNMPSHVHIFGFWNESQGIMGATPEVLFHRVDGKIKSMALAGTLPRNSLFQPEMLLDNKKERQEHQLVIDDIAKQLGQLGNVRIFETEILQLPSLCHLKTNIEVSSSEINTEKIFKMLHPTPALGVYPRDRNGKWFESLPYQQNRSHFGAPILFRVSEQEDICLVAIRSIEWDQAGIKVGAGCGVVEQSDFQNEWQEVNNKAESVFNSLGL